ncbi:MAG: GYD domain-containing protein [Aquabacterium sp.]|nr:GYD domain-containing protein [Aquabacterium sp.]
MVTYVGLMSFTEKGIQNIKGTTQRAAAAKEVAGRFGVNMREIFWTMGDVDMVCIVEAQDEKALTAFNLAIASQGNVRTQSLRAWTAEEMEQILAKMP